MNLSTKTRLTDIQNRLVVARAIREGRGMDWEGEVSKCKLSRLEWINSKILLYM